MLAIDPEKQLQAYTSLRSLEARGQAIDQQIRSLKRCCLDGRPGAMTQLITASSELRWQLRQLDEQAAALDSVLGVVRAGSGAGSSSGSGPVAERAQVANEPSCLRGTTDVLGLPDFISLLSSLRKTGTLTLQSGGSMFVFEFQQGAIVHAVTNCGNPDLRLGTILVAQSKITEEQLKESLDVSAQSKVLLGTQLLRSETVSEADLRSALEVQVRKIFDAAFALENAQFTFLDGSLSNIAQRTSLNTMALLLEAARQSDEGVHELQAAGSSAPKGLLDTILPD